MFLSILFIIFILLLSVHYTNRGRTKLPPGPLCLPIIGSTWALGTDTTQLHRSFTRLAEKWGPIYSMVLGKQPIVVVTDPEIIRESLSDLSSPIIRRFVTRTTFVTNKGESLIFASTKEHWLFLRKLSAPMARNLGIPITQIIMEEMDKLSGAIDKKLNQEVYLNPMFMFFTRNIYLRIAISKSWSFDTHNEEEMNFNNSMLAWVENMASLAEFWPVLDLFSNRSRQKCLDNATHLTHFFEKVAEEREKNPISGESRTRDLLDIYLAEKRTNPEFTNNALFTSLRDIMIAATFTAADTLDWILLYLSANPEMQEKCHQEIKNKLQGRRPTMDDQHELPYLDCVIKETFRLRPPAPLSLPHFAETDFVLHGFEIKKGTVVMQNLYGLGNMDKFYENSAVFDPDRWIRQPELSTDLLHYGYGPTMCLGMPIAKQEVFLTAATFLQKYKFCLGPSSPSPDFNGEWKVTFNPKKWLTIISLR
eukprot:Phypoly_transcript_07512.p1 GENE.Phypoly_transcript_07512~~Phypoly_transcript_07512.p1  ORF type:complete len:478 (+),score=51.68 Phypoly_transcript_07512:63-1496(+)